MRGAHTGLSVATIAASGDSRCYSPPHFTIEKSAGSLHDDDALSLVASDTEFQGEQPTPLDPSTVASSLQILHSLYNSEEKVGSPLCDSMAESLNLMGKKHIEKSSLEDLMDKQSRPSNIDLQLKQVNEEIYSRQVGQMSHARRKDGSLKKVNNLLLKSMVPLMLVVDNLYLADTTGKPAPSMKAVFDQCITSLTLLCEANLEVETQRREAFKPTTPTLYKSLITKPGESRTLLFGDNMEEQMKALESKDKLQKSLAQEKATGSKKQWSTSSSTFSRYVPYGKPGTSNQRRAPKNLKGFPKSNDNRINTTSGKPAYNKKKWYNNRK